MQEKLASPDVEKQYNRPYEAGDIGAYKTRFPNVNERSVMWKIDLRVVPVLCLLYLLAFLDRCVQLTILMV